MRGAWMLAGACGLALGVGAFAQLDLDEPVDDGAVSELVDGGVGAAGGGAGGAPIEAPGLARSVQNALAVSYLTDEERRELRVFHGLWNSADLGEDPALADTGDVAARRRIATAALIAHDYLHPVFEMDGVARESVDAALASGDLDRAERGVGLIGATTAWSERVRGDIAAARGDREAAQSAYERSLAVMGGLASAPAAGVVEGVRSLRGLVRLGFRADQGAAYREMLSMLSAVHQEKDRLYWPALVLEAEILREAGRWAEASEAALSALSLNPRSAGAWAVLGGMSAGAFDKARADAIAARLEEIVRSARAADGVSGAVSVDAALIRSRERLRSDDPEGALVGMAAALEAFPLHAGLVARAAGVAALSYEESRIEPALSVFDAVRPGGALGLYEVGRALSDRRQYGLSGVYLRRAVEREPWWSAPVTELGLMELQAGNDGESLAALERAVALDPFNERAENSLRLVRELMGWEVIESEHFRVRYRAGVDAVLAREMLSELEATHDAVVSALDHVPGRKTTLELMPDSEWFAVRVTGMPSVFTMAASTGPVVAMEAPKEGPLHTGEYNWLQVFRHEYVHTVTLSMTRNRIPHWFTEAAAVYLEDVPREGRRWRMLRDAWLSGGLLGPERINLGFIRPETPQERSLAYAQSEWMYEFMVNEWGEDLPRRLMAGFAEGLREDEVFERELGVDSAAFHGMFRVWAGDELRRVGMLNDPTLPALMVDETLVDEDLRDAAAAWLRSGGMALARAGAGLGGAWEDAEGGPEIAEFDDLLLETLIAERPGHAGLIAMSVARSVEPDGRGVLDEREVELLERMIAARPVDPFPQRALARHWIAVGEPARAEAHLAFLDVREVNSNAYAVELAQRAAARGAWGESLRYVERATRVSPYDANLRELAAEAALRARDLERARHHLLALRDLEPERAVHGKRLEALEGMMGG